MSRAGLSGFLIGGIVAVTGVGTLSLIADPPSGPLFSSDVPDQADAPSERDSEVAAADRTRDVAPQSADTPRVDTPETVVISNASAITVPSQPQPQVVSTIDQIDTIGPQQDRGIVRVALEKPVKLNPKAALPETPPSEAIADIQTKPSEPKQQVLAEVQVSLGRKAALVAPSDAFASDLDLVVSQDEGLQWLAPLPNLTAPDGAQTPNLVTETYVPVVVATNEPEAAPEVELDVVAEAAPDIAQDVTPAPVEEPQPEPVVVVDAAPSQPEIDTTVQTPPTTEDIVVAQAQTTEPASTRPTIGKPARSLIPAREPETTEVATVVTEEVAPTGALDSFKEPFADPQQRPLLSIILMDTGEKLDGGPVGIQALGSFPYSLSFAVDAELPDAADRAAEYRSQGFEVLALVDLPGSLTAADTEVAMTAALGAVPEAVGVLEGPESGLQGNKDISDQVTEILLASGHGMLWRPNGLDTAQKLAVREGLPSRTIFRDFDSKDQTPTVIRRFLDQAAFKAGQENGVVMVGRVRADTISALLVWGLQDRAQRVAVSPISAVLKAGAAQ